MVHFVTDFISIVIYQGIYGIEFYENAHDLWTLAFVPFMAQCRMLLRLEILSFLYLFKYLYAYFDHSSGKKMRLIYKLASTKLRILTLFSLLLTWRSAGRILSGICQVICECEYDYSMDFFLWFRVLSHSYQIEIHSYRLIKQHTHIILYSSCQRHSLILEIFAELNAISGAMRDAWKMDISPIQLAWCVNCNWIFRISAGDISIKYI